MKKTILIVVGILLMYSEVTLASEIFDKSVNQSLGKNAIASSGDAYLAIDGDNGSRWESSHTDNEWWYIDLDKALNLNKIEILWEGAYGKHIKIQTSLNAPEEGGEIVWTDFIELDRTLSNILEPEIIDINIPARYIRLLGIERALPYGYSFYEFRVFATSEYVHVDKPILETLQIEDVEAIEGEDIDINILALNQVGSPIKDITYEFVSSDNTAMIIREENDKYLLTPLKSGDYFLTVIGSDKDGNKANVTINVIIKEKRKLSNIEISYNNAPALVGVETELYVLFTDQYSQAINPESIEWITTSGSVNNNLYIPNSKGLSIVQAKCNDILSNELQINVVSTDENIAFNKSIIDASTLDNISFINDGDNGTRWIYGQPGESNEYEAYFVIDLGCEYNVELIDLYWEGASPSDYKIFYSTDNKDYGNAVYEVKDMPGMASIHKYHYGENKTARYIKVKSTKAATGYGISLWEMKVHGASFATQIESINNDNKIKRNGIYDLKGNKIYDSENNNSINIQNLPFGIYIIDGIKMWIGK